MLRHGKAVLSSLELKGLVFNRLTILKEEIKNKHGHRMASALCECGNTGIYVLFSITSGRTKSCGCLQKERAASAQYLHGLTKHSLYFIWNSIKWRCYNPKCPAFKNYGERGVRMCDEWKNDFKLFYDWCINNGWEEGLELDKDILGNGLLYSPETCCFVTTKENSRHRRNTVILEFNGVKKPLTEWAELFNKNPAILSQRIRRNGWSIERAITT